ncbi:MAG: energy-coupling factor ABC transporter ATP-binding protein [Deltaproteobacteria bacterium]|jgi:biotin transport system ATP-binding protein|nr:energy-coupling factor ABC transporter ATP-binding protein [Deltaproteobacteria bacterium]
MESADAILTAVNVSFAYPGRESVIRDLSFGLRGGEILGLAGQNGAGKSTLLDLLAGFKRPTQGRITLSGRKAAGKGGRKRVALLPQNVDFFILGDSPLEDLALALGLEGAAARDERIALIAESWSLGDVLDRPVETLSLGQKKRLALASSLAAEPEVLLLDEPFFGLDWPGSLRFLEDLKTLPEKRLIVVLATHEPSLVAGLVDKWLLMKPNEYLLAPPGEALGRLAEFGVRPAT